MSPSVQDRANRSRRNEFSGRDVCPPWGFKGRPLNMYRWPSGADYGHTLNLDWNIGHSWDGFGHIHWDLIWDRHYMFRDWGRVGSRDDWLCVRDFVLQEIFDGFKFACCGVPIS